MKKSSATEMDLFARALEMAPEEQMAFLRDACGEDTDLLRRLQRLIQAHEGADGVLPDRSLTAVVGKPAERPGAKIGRYKLLEQIGEGGFGVVYVAEQEEPVRRRVALKIIKLGMDTRQVIARFEAERQALAMMDHPHIAKVLDAGATEAGRPYFVMELVRGVPITEFCEKNRLSVRQRLELFIPVCQAVQHAHQKGVIHRDLKPSNILVTMADGRPHPMVIDFGVAKAMNHRLTEKTLYTRFAQMIGTPAYMSPEQAEMSRDDVDTRSDIYSLGILLYELLTGTTPFPEERLREAGVAEIQRIIREEEPERPSTLVSRMSERPRSMAAGEDDEPGNLTRLLRGDLDWIILKAIDKDRTRRYETANGLAADLQRHLSDKPVTASPPSALYQLSKFTRRHRTAVVAGVAMALTLLLGAGLATWQALRATKAERLAADRLTEAEDAREAAEQASTRAEAEAAEALRHQASLEALNNWVTDKLIARPWMPNPSEAIAANTPHAEVISRAAQSLDDAFPDQPEVEMLLRVRLGDSLAFLDRIEEALPHLRRALSLAKQHLGDTDARTLEIQFLLATTLTYAHQKDLANPEGLEGMRVLEEVCDQCLKHLGLGHALTLDYQISLAFRLTERGDRKQAEAILASLEPSIEALPDDYVYRGVIGESTKQKLQDAWRFQMSFTKPGAVGRRLRQEMLEDVRTRRLASDHPDLYSSHEMEFLLFEGEAVRASDHDPERALQLLNEGFAASRKLVGNSYPTYNFSLVIGLTHFDLGDYDQALACQRECLSALKSTELLPQLVQEQVYRVAFMSARLGHWTAAADDLANHHALPQIGLPSLARQALLRLLARDNASWRELRSALGARLTEAGATDNSLDLLEMLLVLSAFEPEIPGLDSWLEALPNPAADDLERAYIDALTAFRSQRWGDVVEEAWVIESRGPWRLRAALMGYLTAISQRHLGNEDEASRLIDRSDAVLSGFLQAGELTAQWEIPGLCLLASRHAHKALSKEVPGLDVDAEWLAARRASWKPVKELLWRADRRAQWQDYQAAAAAYRQVLNAPQSQGSLAVFSDSDIRKMALAFVLTDATDDYVQVCQQAYAEVSPTGWHVDHWPLSLRPEVLPEKTREKLSESYPNQESIRWHVEKEKPFHDHLLKIGLGCFQQRRYSDAALALGVARKGLDDPSLSLLARLLYAKARLHLGDTGADREFREVLNEFNQTLDRANGRLDRDWTVQATVSLILRQAEDSVGRPNGDQPDQQPVPNPTPNHN